jgi:hypothetical protein
MFKNLFNSLDKIDEKTVKRKANGPAFRHHHHQPINVPTAGAQAFFMNYT